MKLHRSKIKYMFLLLPLLVLAKDPEQWNGKYTKEKTINKEFNVSPTALLDVQNSYGNLYVTSWNENRIVIQVSIKTNGDDEEKVQKKLEDISVEFAGTQNEVFARTVFGADKSSWGWNWWKRSNVNMEVNYTIKVPVTNSLKLDNDYGSINVGKIDGHVEISCDYGKINIEELNADDNQLAFDYTNNSTIGFVKSAKIKADYSSYEIEEAGDLVVIADYTTSKIIKVNSLEYTCDYGNLKVGDVNNLKGNGDYLTARFGKINGCMNINSDYGSIRVEEVSESAGNIDIKSDYTGIKIGYDQGYHFDFVLDLEYAGLRCEKDLDIKIKREGVTDKYYEGYSGSKGKNKVVINSDYGSVIINKN